MAEQIRAADMESGRGWTELLSIYLVASKDVNIEIIYYFYLVFT